MTTSHQPALAIQISYQATLDDFIWGNNKLLQQLLNQALYNNGERFFYIWGEKGTGKSHLLQGCCHAMGNAGKTAAYLPLSLLKEWGPDCLEGMENHELVALDDIELIAGDKTWEEAVFHLYNRVRENPHGVFLISGSSTPARAAIQLPDLRSRLSACLVSHLEDLSDDLKVEALQKHAHERGFELGDSVAMFLINRCARSMHALYDALDQLDKASLAAQRKITIPFVKSVLFL